MQARTKNVFSVFTLGFFLALAGCNSSNSKAPGAPAPSDRVFDQSALITSDLIMKSVVISCQNCHAGSQRPTLSSPSLVLTSIHKVLNEVEAGDMPPQDHGYKPLTNCQIAILKKWSDLGGPDNSDVKVVSLPECAVPAAHALDQ